MRTTSVVRSVAGARVGVGLALTVATRPVLRLTVRGEPHSAPLVLFARTVGIRDLVFGAASFAAAGRPDEARNLRRWLAAWLVSDVADVAGVGDESVERGRALAAHEVRPEANHTAGAGDGADGVVAQIALERRHRPGSGVGADDGRRAVLDHLEQRRLVGVGAVDDSTE